MNTITLKIDGMHCTSCAMSIDGELEDLDGVEESNTNYAKSVTEVKFDPQQVTEERLISTIGDLGYTASADGK